MPAWGAMLAGATAITFSIGLDGPPLLTLIVMVSALSALLSYGGPGLDLLVALFAAGGVAGGLGAPEPLVSAICAAVAVGGAWLMIDLPRRRRARVAVAAAAPTRP